VPRRHYEHRGPALTPDPSFLGNAPGAVLLKIVPMTYSRGVVNSNRTDNDSA
jgi:hypothetical protein